MIDRPKKISETRLARGIIFIGGISLVAASVNALTPNQLSDKEIQKIEARLGGVASDKALDDYLTSKRDISSNKDKQNTNTPEIESLNYELSPIVSIKIAGGLIKEKKLISYDWEANMNSKRDVEYNPGNDFDNMYVSIEDNDPDDDGVIDEQRGRLGLIDGELQGAVFVFGHTHSNPEIDAVMDKIGEVKIGDEVTAKTESDVVYVFTVDDIKLANKLDPNDKAKSCGTAGRVFTCFVKDDSRTDSAVYLCLKFKGIQLDNQTILAK